MLLGFADGSIAAQDGATLESERAAHRTWLLTAGNSPYAVLVQRHIGPGLSLGPAEADLPLEGIAATRLTERSGVPYLRRDGKESPLPRFRMVPLGQYRLFIAGPPGRSSVTLYGPGPRNAKPPDWYDYDPELSVQVTLAAPSRPGTRRMLAADGLEVVATEAGTARMTLGGREISLAVFRIPDPAGEESELEIFFRDPTNAATTYPAGRFVSLEPLGGTRYRLDFNRARNPFCAYSTAFACPLPWRGNSVPLPITAGEKYAGGGLTPSEPGSAQ